MDADEIHWHPITAPSKLAQMGILYDQLQMKLVSGMSIPDEIRQLYEWIEVKRTYIDRKDGARIGFLFPEREQKAGWTKTERLGGTNIEFAAGGNAGLDHWFGHDRPEVLNRLCVFAQTGAEGSMAALWIGDDGLQKIVHLGSGSGSILVCVLAPTPVDFIRLLAIGYDEICWDEDFSAPPNKGDFLVHPHIEFQEWVVNSFGVTIPKTALEIVKHPSRMGDKNPQDEFARWVNLNTR